MKTNAKTKQSNSNTDKSAIESAKPRNAGAGPGGGPDIWGSKKKHLKEIGVLPSDA